MIVTFLALLELIRLREFQVRQDSAFADIEIERLSEEVDDEELGI